MNKKNKSKAMLYPNLPLAGDVSNIYEMDDVGASTRKWVAQEAAMNDGACKYTPEDLEFMKLPGKYADKATKYYNQRIYSVNLSRDEFHNVYKFINEIHGNEMKPLTAGNLMAKIIGLDKAGKRTTFKAGKGITTKRFINILNDIQKKTGIDLIKKKSNWTTDKLSTVDKFLKKI